MATRLVATRLVATAPVVAKTTPVVSRLGELLTDYSYRVEMPDEVTVEVPHEALEMVHEMAVEMPHGMTQGMTEELKSKMTNQNSKIVTIVDVDRLVRGHVAIGMLLLTAGQIACHKIAFQALFSQLDDKEKVKESY